MANAVVAVTLLLRAVGVAVVAAAWYATADVGSVSKFGFVNGCSRSCRYG